MIDIVETMRSLASLRPVFHSEADFQHALAWQIHQQHPELKIRLEYRPSKVNQKMYVDIWVERGSQLCAIELKYKTKSFSKKVCGEQFNLLNQAAQDLARYDFCKDISRVERLANAYPALVGFAVLVTNDSGYWRKSDHRETVDSAFRLHQGAKLARKLSWDSRASKGTTKGRAAPIRLKRSHLLEWMDYSKFESVPKNGSFRSLVVTTGSATA